MKAIITVIGKDKVGIIAGVSSILAEMKINILDISQTIMQEYFTMIMLTDLSCSVVSLIRLRLNLMKKVKNLGFQSRYRMKAYSTQ